MSAAALVNTQQFQWSRADRMYSACMSDLGLPAGVVPDDLRVVSQHTGREVDFRVRFQEVSDGELRYVLYRNVAVDVWVMLFND